MRKWTYLVAALLMSGTAATFTSCIDTNEPAGIEELRGAKADFIRAKADYERALVELQKVKVDREKVQLELDNIVLETERLKFELAQAQNKKDKLDIELQIQLMQKNYEEQMLYADQRIANAKKALLEALNSLNLAQLTDRDNKFQAEIAILRSKISSILTIVASSQNNLNSTQLNKMLFIAQSKYYGAGLELTKTKYEKDLEILEALLDNYTEIESADVEALTKQKANIESQIIALREKEEQEWDKYQNMKNDEEFTTANKAVQDIIVKQEAESSFTLPMDKVNAAIQEDLYSALTSATTGTGPSAPKVYVSTEIDKIFNEEHDAMIADLVLNKDLLNPTSSSTSSLQYKDLATKMDEFAGIILEKGKENYVADYNNLFSGASLSASDIFDENNEVVPSISAKIEAEKNRRASDQAKYKADYDAALNAWIDSYIAFNAALEAYGGYKTSKPMDDMKKTIADIEDLYNKSLEPGATAITLAKAKEWRTTIEGLYKKRIAVDDVLATEYKIFCNNYVKDATTGDDKIDDSNLSSQLPAFIGAAKADFGNASTTLNLSVAYDTDYEGASTYQKLVNANVEFFKEVTSVSGNYGLADIIVPILKEDGTKPEKPEDAIPADIKAEDAESGSVYNLYWTSVNFDLVYPAFTNYANWKDTYDFIAEAQAKEKEAIDQLAADKDAKIAEYNDLFTALWEVELKGFLINGTQNNSQHGTSWFSQSNPYADFAVGNDINDGTAIPFDDQTEYAQLKAQLDLIDAAINNGELSYVKYDYTTGTFSTSNGTEALSNIINDTKSNINTVKGQIASYEFQIAQFNENGYNGTTTIDYYDQQINALTEVLKNNQADLDMYTAQLQKVLDAYAAAE